MRELLKFRQEAEARYAAMAPLKWKEEVSGKLVYHEELRYSDFTLSYPRGFPDPDDAGFEVNGKGDFSAYPLLEAGTEDPWSSREVLASAEDKLDVLALAGWKHGLLLRVDDAKSASVSIRLTDPAPYRIVVSLGENSKLSATVIPPSAGAGEGVTGPVQTASLGLVTGRSSRLELSQLAGSFPVEYVNLRGELGVGSTTYLKSLHVAGTYGRYFGEVKLAEGSVLQADMGELVPKKAFGDFLFNVVHGPRSQSDVELVAAVLGKVVARGLTGIADRSADSRANLQERVVMIGKEAKAITSPSLDIYEREVQARHGSWSGRVGQRELFYLESRGLSEKEAMALVVRGLLSKFTSSLPVNDLVEAIIGGGERSRHENTQGLPDFWQKGKREAACLPRQRGHQPKASSSYRGRNELLPEDKCQRPQGPLRDERGGHSGVRRRAQEHSVLCGFESRGNSVHQERYRGLELGRFFMGPR